MAVGGGDAQALRGDGRLLGVGDVVAVDPAPDLHGLLLALFLLAAYVGDDVVDHFRPGLEGLSCAGDGLIGADEDLVQPVLQPQRGEGGDVALDGAVALDGDEAARGAQALFLRGDDLQVLGVYLGDDHRHVRSPAVGAVVGDDRRLAPGVLLLERQYLLLLHVHGGEDEVHLAGDGSHVRGVLDDDTLCALGHRDVQRPTLGDGLLVGLARAALTRGDDLQLEPGVVRYKGYKALTHHTGAANDAYFKFFHCKTFLSPYDKSIRMCAE